MVARLKKVDPPIADKIYNAVFLSQASRPRSAWQVFKRLRLTKPGKRISQNSLHQVQGTKGHSSVYPGPVPEVLHKFGLEHRNPVTRYKRPVSLTSSLGQGPTRFGVLQSMTAGDRAPELVQGLSATARRFWASEGDAPSQSSSQAPPPKPAPHPPRPVVG